MRCARIIVTLAVVVGLAAVVSFAAVGEVEGRAVPDPGRPRTARVTMDLLPGYPESGIFINLPGVRLVLIVEGRVTESVPIAAGRPGRETPTGDFQVTNMIPEPWWYPMGGTPVAPGPDNPLGSWWFGLDRPGYGIHGTNDESSIGGLVSDGCVRLHDEDVKRLAEQVEVGMPVRIAYQPLSLFPLVREEGVRWHLGIYPDPYGRDDSPDYAEARAFLRENHWALTFAGAERLPAALEGDQLPVEVPVASLPELPGCDDPDELKPVVIGEDGVASYARLMGGEQYLPLGAIVHGINRELERGWGFSVRIAEGKQLTPSQDGFSGLKEGSRRPVVDLYRFPEEPAAARVPGITCDGEVYVPREWMKDVLPVTIAHDEYSVRLGWRTLRLGHATIGVFPHRPELEPDMIPVRELEMIFGGNLAWCARERWVALFARSLDNVYWGEAERPWVSLTEVADRLNMRTEVSDGAGVRIYR